MYELSEQMNSNSSVLDVRQLIRPPQYQDLSDVVDGDERSLV